MDRTTLSGVVAAVARRWWLALVVLLAVLVADAAFTLRSPRTYLARAILLIGPSQKVDPGQLVYSVDALGRARIVGTYAEVLASDLIRREALGRLGQPVDSPSPSTIDVKTAALADTTVIQVMAETSDPDLSAAVANTVGEVGAEHLSRLFPIYELTFVTRAAPPSQAYRPDVIRNASLGLLLGLVLGCVAAYAYDALARRSSHQPDAQPAADAAREAGVPAAHGSRTEAGL
jgi:succinoglycan biosynthesis transport protein ExoP